MIGRWMLYTSITRHSSARATRTPPNRGIYHAGQTFTVEFVDHAQCGSASHPLMRCTLGHKKIFLELSWKIIAGVRYRVLD